MKEAHRALSALAIAAALGGATLALAQALPPIAVDAPAQTLHVPEAPGAPFTIETAGEYQLDAASTELDVELAIVREDAIVASDSDSGDGTDARLTTFLAPGAYEAVVTERSGRATRATIRLAALPPRESAASIAPGGRAATVTVPESELARDASVDLGLTIAEAATYRIDAGDETLDAELVLVQSGAVLASDSDSGGSTRAQIVRELTPGEYTVRVRDRLNRAGSLTVTVVTH